MIRKIIVGTVGSVVLVAGFAMILLPGPAIIFIPLGIAILSLEFEWAKRSLDWIRRKVGRKRDQETDE